MTRYITEGDLVSVTTKRLRTSAAPVFQRTLGRVTETTNVCGETFVLFTPLAVFCWVGGYPLEGTSLPLHSGCACAEISEVSRLFHE
jgi:hypothetical protein